MNQVFAAQDQQASATAAAAAAATQQAATQQLTAAWQSVTDTIFSEVSRIQGLLSVSSATSMAAAQSDFTIATAQARSGDQNAAKLLPGLSQSLLAIAASDSSTALDLARIQGQTAGSLATTGSILSTDYGLTLPSFAVGTDFVPRDMVAQIHRGEKITPAEFNKSDPNAELVAEIKALRADVANLRNSSEITASSSKKTSELLLRVTQDGNSLLTTPA